MDRILGPERLIPIHSRQTNYFFGALLPVVGFLKYLKNSEFNVITVDFKVGNKIIEFYGDFWHANPKLYESDFVFERDNMKKTAKLIQDRDISRVKKIEDFGVVKFPLQTVYGVGLVFNGVMKAFD